MGCVDGLALSAVCGGRVGELDMLIDVPGRQGPVTPAAGDVDREVGIESGDDPGVPVGDVKLAVVAAGGDWVADAEDPAVRVPTRCKPPVEEEWRASWMVELS